ncbi:MAG: glycosyltransferase family 39 protein [Tepidisphaerales bacterium]
MNAPLTPMPTDAGPTRPSRGRGSSVGPLLVLAAVVAVFLLRTGPSVREYAQTVDETYHVGAAVSYLEARTLVLGVQHPPLGRLPAAAVAWAMGARLPEYAGATTSRREDVAYAAGTQVLLSRDANWYWRLLGAMRWSMLVWGVVALVYAYLLGRFVAGPWAGAAAATLLSLDTTLLGHALWVCTDVAAAAGFLAALYHGLKWVERPTWGRAAAAGVAGGLAVGLKFTAGLALPALLLALAVVGLARWRGARVTSAASGPSVCAADLPGAGAVRRAVQLPAIVLVSLLVLWGLYKFHVGPLGDSDTLASAPQWQRLPAWVKETPLPMPSLWIGLGRLAAHSATGSDAYLFGQTRPDGFWYYFPVLITYKTPVALLAVLLVSAILAFEPRTRSVWVVAGLVVPAGVYLAVSMAGSVQIGIRHVLPLLAVLYVLAGAVMTRSASRVTLLLAAVALAAAETLPRHPDYLAFFNQLARTGGQDERIAADSNLDWGQDLARLARRVAAEPALAAELSAVYPLGDRQAPLFRVLGLDAALIDAPPRPGSLVAVSVTRRILDRDRLRFIAAAAEVERVGRGIVLYRMPPGRLPPPSVPAREPF